MAQTEPRERKDIARTQVHTAALRARLGPASLRARVAISTAGLVAVTGLVVGTVLSAAAVVAGATRKLPDGAMPARVKRSRWEAARPQHGGRLNPARPRSRAQPRRRPATVGWRPVPRWPFPACGLAPPTPRRRHERYPSYRHGNPATDRPPAALAGRGGQRAAACADSGGADDGQATAAGDQPAGRGQRRADPGGFHWRAAAGPAAARSEIGRA